MLANWVALNFSNTAFMRLPFSLYVCACEYECIVNHMKHQRQNRQVRLPEIN